MIFVQLQMGVVPSPILIEGTSDPAVRLREIDREGPFVTYWVGWIPTETPRELATALGEQYKASHIRNGWYEPSVEVLGYVQHVASQPLFDLLGQLKQHSHPEGTATIEEIAKYLGVSVPTVRRMVRDEEIPVLRVGRQLRFFPADVIASLQHGGRLR